MQEPPFVGPRFLCSVFDSPGRQSRSPHPVLLTVCSVNICFVVVPCVCSVSRVLKTSGHASSAGVVWSKWEISKSPVARLVRLSDLFPRSVSWELSAVSLVEPHVPDACLRSDPHVACSFSWFWAVRYSQNFLPLVLLYSFRVRAPLSLLSSRSLIRYIPTGLPGEETGAPVRGVTHSYQELTYERTLLVASR